MTTAMNCPKSAIIADRIVREIHRHFPCKACGLIWCGHSGCSRWLNVRDMYDWYPDKQAHRLKPKYRYLER
jgi:hypothetical protein